MNTADLARKLPTQARYDLLRIFADPESRRPVHPALTQKALVDVIGGRQLPTELGTKVMRHLDAGHRVQVRGRMVRIVQRALDAQTVDADIEQEFARFTEEEREEFIAALDRVRVQAHRYRD